jgi:hypothetical protein
MEPIEIKEGNVKARFKDIHTYNFYQLVLLNWMAYKKTYKSPDFYNFKFELLDQLEGFMDEVWKDVFSEMSNE